MKESPQSGDRVRVAKLSEDGTKGMMINPRHLRYRMEGVIGTCQGYVPGHGGDVVWIKHDDSPEIRAQAYCFDELEPLDQPTQTPQPDAEPEEKP